MEISRGFYLDKLITPSFIMRCIYNMDRISGLNQENIKDLRFRSF